MITDDDKREGHERFRLILSIPYNVKAQGVWTGYPHYADVLIIGMYVCMYVFFMYVCMYVCMYMHTLYST